MQNSQILIGLMGGPAKKKVDGKLKAVPGVKMSAGAGFYGEALDP